MLREMCGIIMTSEVKLNCTLNIGLLSIECFYKPINKPVTLKPSNQRIFNIFKTIEFWKNPPVNILSFEMQKRNAETNIYKKNGVCGVGV